MRIYLDLEYCYPGMTRDSGRPGDHDQRQIVQIAAIKYDEQTGEELDALDIFVKPTYIAQLPQFFIELTGITQRKVDTAAISLPDALTQLVKFCDGYEIYTFDKDWNVLRQNYGYLGMDFDFENRPFTRVKTCLGEWGVDGDAYSSGTLHHAAGIEMDDATVHNALHDVRSMAVAMHYFEHTSSAT